MELEAARSLSEGNRLRNAGRLADAAAAYRRAIAIAPQARDAHYNLGIALRQSGELREAILEFRAASRIDPMDFDAVQNAVDTLALAIERDERPFGRSPSGASEGAAPVSIIVCSIDAPRLAAMQSSFRAALGAREHEFVVVRDAHSLSEGYERGLRAARHDFVVFSHDDVELVSPAPFEALERALSRHHFVGLVGARRVSGPAVAWAGHPHLFGAVAYPATERWRIAVYSLATGVLGGMQALDGMLFAARRDCAISVGFDAEAFDGFHFYDLDFTYRAHLAGHSIAVTTEVLAIHASEGSFDESWRRYAERFREKFPALGAAQGPSFSFSHEIATRDRLLRFHEELNAMGALA